MNPFATNSLFLFAIKLFANEDILSEKEGHLQVTISDDYFLVLFVANICANDSKTLQKHWGPHQGPDPNGRNKLFDNEGFERGRSNPVGPTRPLDEVEGLFHLVAGELSGSRVKNFK